MSKKLIVTLYVILYYHHTFSFHEPCAEHNSVSIFIWHTNVDVHGVICYLFSISWYVGNLLCISIVYSIILTFFSVIITTIQIVTKVCFLAHALIKVNCKLTFLFYLVLLSSHMICLKILLYSYTVFIV